MRDAGILLAARGIAVVELVCRRHRRPVRVCSDRRVGGGNRGKDTYLAGGIREAWSALRLLSNRRRYGDPCGIGTDVGFSLSPAVCSLSGHHVSRGPTRIAARPSSKIVPVLRQLSRKYGVPGNPRPAIATVRQRH